MTDLCDSDGAGRLAAKIQDFWRKRGFDVVVVRSNMINGMPTKFVGAEAT